MTKFIIASSDIEFDLLTFSCSQGSVVVNFTVYYVKVADSEVLLLQDYITTTGKMYNLSTVFQEAKPMEGKIIKFFSYAKSDLH